MSKDGVSEEPETGSVYWNNPDGIKIATYKWLPENEVKFLMYLVQGYCDCVHAYAKLVKAYTDAGGAVYTHDHMYHGEG